VVRSGGVHKLREEFLLTVAEKTGLSIFSPSSGFTRRDDARAAMKSSLYRVAHGLRKFGIPESRIAALPLLGRTLGWEAAPVQPVNTRLRPFLRPAVFGIEMYQVIRDSGVTLNIHADSSPRFASNMRLFETTGAGTCLVTDWRENLPELFTPDEEVVTYRSAAECVEKIRWLLDHPREREEIAAAGKRRTLSQHTFAHRAQELDRIIRSTLAKKAGRGGCR
jgi:spore maturation protein CgeB